MYTKKIPFKDFNDNPHNSVVHFNLTEREVLKNLVSLKTIIEWKDSMGGPDRELTTEEVVEFYNAFEDILLEAWGEPSADGLHFRKGGKYEFEESALFNACMVEFVTNPQETGSLLDGIMPKGMEDMVRKADANMIKAADDTDNEEIKAELARLRAQLADRAPQIAPEAQE